MNLQIVSPPMNMSNFPSNLSESTFREWTHLKRSDGNYWTRLPLIFFILFSENYCSDNGVSVLKGSLRLAKQ